MKRLSAFLLGTLLLFPSLCALEVEQTLAMIKPDATDHVIHIIQRIKKIGLKIVELKQQKLSRKKAVQFYQEHEGKKFFKDLIKHVTSGPSIFMILQGNNAIAKWRTLMGKTNPRNASKDSLRKEYGTNQTKNAVHGSDSADSAAREIGIIFDTSDYGDTDREWFKNTKFTVVSEEEDEELNE